jgi:PHP family Zn ribbon phosphoesterase
MIQLGIKGEFTICSCGRDVTRFIVRDDMAIWPRCDACAVKIKKMLLYSNIFDLSKEEFDVYRIMRY